jgi:hypothetical protein
MAAGKRSVSGRMPILGCKTVVEKSRHQPVRYRHHFLSAGYRQLAAGHESRLDIDQAEHVGRLIERDEASHWTTLPTTPVR